MAGACFSPWSLESRNILADLGGWGMASSPARLTWVHGSLHTPKAHTSPSTSTRRARARSRRDGMGQSCSLSHPEAVPSACHICCHHTRLVQGLTQW